MNKGKRFVLTALLLVCAVLTVSCSCGKKKDTRTYYNNEEDALVFSTQDLDKVFNPFFSTTAADSNVVGMTQIGMLSNDKEGKVAYGDDEACVTKDLQIVTEGTEDVDQTTTYYFVLKNNVRFSNGSYMTMKDVLFNLYVYLDPAYTGSATMYSTDIVGLKEYRTQQATEKEQDSFNLKFQQEAEARIDALVEVSEYIFDDHKLEAVSNSQFIEYLNEYALETGDSYNESYKHVVEDYNKACELFKEELESDYNNYKDSYKDQTFTDSTGKIYKELFTSDAQEFLYAEGYISWSKKDAKLTSTLTNDYKDLASYTMEQAINVVYNDKIPSSISEIIQYWATSVELNDYLTNLAMEEYFKSGESRTYTNISGIKFANQNSSVTVNGVTYDVPEYNADGSVKSGYEVLSITINDIDPKAIWNFSFGVAPMYYYSDSEHIAAFDYVSNFGVEYASQSFMENVVNAPEKVSLPVGAGPYAASKSSGGIENITASDFYNLGIVYFERNPYYVMGPAEIKSIRYKVVSSTQILSDLYSGAVDYAEPNAKPKTISELDSKKDEGISNKSIQTAGYGYIGVNAGKVPDLQVRQAIMYSINTLECVSYYQTTAKAIYRSMSMSSWAYPTGCTSYYPYIGGEVPSNLKVVDPQYKEYVTELGLKAGDVMTEEQQLAFLRKLVGEEGAGYKLNDSGVLQKGSNVLEYKFTIAGEETDHPAYNALYHASEILNKIGFNITVGTDANALKKLNTGDLTVWAAAWGSTIDPDMYQVYHKDSKATSVLNWGYKQILLNAGGKYDTEVELINELSDIIDDARKTNDENERKKLYSKALDIVMQLAIELPTYQRDDLFAYNSYKIDESTLNSDTSPYKGLTSNIHTVSLYEER